MGTPASGLAVGEEVVMLGRFLGYDGMDENKPAARFGHLAMAQPVPIKHPWGFAQPSFLIEMPVCIRI
jgi:hypothetical protein